MPLQAAGPNLQARNQVAFGREPQKRNTAAEVTLAAGTGAAAGAAVSPFLLKAKPFAEAGGLTADAVERHAGKLEKVLGQKEAAALTTKVQELHKSAQRGFTRAFDTVVNKSRGFFRQGNLIEGVTKKIEGAPKGERTIIEQARKSVGHTLESLRAAVEQVVKPDGVDAVLKKVEGKTNAATAGLQQGLEKLFAANGENLAKVKTARPFTLAAAGAAIGGALYGLNRLIAGDKKA